MQNQMDTTVSNWENFFWLISIPISILLLVLLGQYLTPFFGDLIVQLKLELTAWTRSY